MAFQNSAASTADITPSLYEGLKTLHEFENYLTDLLDRFKSRQ